MNQIVNLSYSAGIPLKYANRHGLITGPTGTGKTVSLMKLAEGFVKQGVPVLVADVKGDIAALTRSVPSRILDVFGRNGEAVNITVSDMGPDLLARTLELTDTQAGVLEVVFAYAAQVGIHIQNLAELNMVMNRVLELSGNGLAYHVSAASVGVIQRAILRLKRQGGAALFGKIGQHFDTESLLEPKAHILDARGLIGSPRVYAAFLLWLLSDLYKRASECGDLDKPRLVLFFDEAHLLFQDMPPALLSKIEQTVRLIRSKGIGVYFVSQSENDVPALIRDQLAHKVKHDHALPVGSASFTTLTPQGRGAGARIVKVEMPECPLGALAVHELPKRPAQASGNPDLASTLPEWVVLLVGGLGSFGFLAFCLYAPYVLLNLFD